jgi:hypothetical protein
MRGVRVARERRALRSPNIGNHDLHRNTDPMAGRTFEQGQAAVPAPEGAGVSKSAVSRRFVALSAPRMTSDLSRLDPPKKNKGA